MIKNPNTLETGLNKQTTPAMAETDITHDATERNKSSSPNTPSTERTNAPPIDRTNRPINRGNQKINHHNLHPKCQRRP